MFCPDAFSFVFLRLISTLYNLPFASVCFGLGFAGAVTDQKLTGHAVDQTCGPEMKPISAEMLHSCMSCHSVSELHKEPKARDLLCKMLHCSSDCVLWRPQ